MFIRLVVNQSAASVRYVTHTDGREYLIAPTVAIVEGVMNELLYLEEEIDAYIDAWNGKPLVFGHPTGNGEEDFISANSPEIFAQSPGFYFNATYEDNVLKGEWWIDVARARKLSPHGEVLLSRLKQGEIVEQSTGLFTDVEERVGEYNGEPYKGIARNIRPDHVAILLDEIGACSVEDGCGTPRVNQEEPEQPETEASEPESNEACPCPDGTTDTTEGEVETFTDTPPEPVNNNLRDAWNTITTFLGLKNNQQQEKVVNQGEIMDRTEMIQKILEYAGMKGLPLTLAMLEAAGDEELMALYEKMEYEMMPPEAPEMPESMGDEEEEMEYNEEETPAQPQPEQPAPSLPVAAPQGNAEEENEEEAAAPRGILQLPNELVELTRMLNEVGGVKALKDTLSQFKAAADEEYNQLVSLIAANSSFGEKELKGLEVDHLRKLYANVCQPEPDYSGRGGGLSTTNQDDGWDYSWKEVQ